MSGIIHRRATNCQLPNRKVCTIRQQANQPCRTHARVIVKQLLRTRRMQQQFILLPVSVRSLSCCHYRIASQTRCVRASVGRRWQLLMISAVRSVVLCSKLSWRPCQALSGRLNACGALLLESVDAWMRPIMADCTSCDAPQPAGTDGCNARPAEHRLCELLRCRRSVERIA